VGGEELLHLEDLATMGGEGRAGDEGVASRGLLAVHVPPAEAPDEPGGYCEHRGLPVRAVVEVYDARRDTLRHRQRRVTSL
jgi:hypothetical protein